MHALVIAFKRTQNFDLTPPELEDVQFLREAPITFLWPIRSQRPSGLSVRPHDQQKVPKMDRLKRI